MQLLWGLQWSLKAIVCPCRAKLCMEMSSYVLYMCLEELWRHTVQNQNSQTVKVGCLVVNVIWCCHVVDSATCGCNIPKGSGQCHTGSISHPFSQVMLCTHRDWTCADNVEILSHFNPWFTKFCIFRENTVLLVWVYMGVINLQVASARFARFSYCGRGFARSARFTSYGNSVCTIEVVKLNT